MKEITVTDLEDNFDAVFGEVVDEGEQFTITDEEGQPLAVLVSHEEYESMNLACSNYST